MQLPVSATSSRKDVTKDSHAKASPPLVIDCLPRIPCSNGGSDGSNQNSAPDHHQGTKEPKPRLPKLTASYKDEFAVSAGNTVGCRKRLATARIVRMAFARVIEPPTLHLLAASACATLGIAAIEGSLLCQQWPFWESWEAGQFVLRYSVEQLFPSVVWETQDAKLVAASLGLDPSQVLQELSRQDVKSANILLFTHLLATSRYFFAGFMMIAQLVRAANVSMGTFDEYEERIQLGREPPLSIQNGLVVRLCGRDSHVSEVSLKRMGVNFFPVFEDPQRVKFLIWKHSENKRRPVYWCIHPGLYGSLYSWDRFPTDKDCLLPGINKADKILILEADGTNGNDPLTLGEKAMDLTIEDASQGFRRILERYAAHGLVRGKDFRTLRIYLGNSMETATTGGGHSYTLRHRVHYAKEVDVLIDSRAPVLHKILEWCESVASKDRKLFFQTSSREYFQNLQRLLKEYGYEIYDPLDLRMLSKMRAEIKDENGKKAAKEWILLSALLEGGTFMEEEWNDHKAFLEQVSGKESSTQHERSEMLRKVAKMAKLPRLVHMKTTAETVNAVDALIMAGEVDAANCCALIDREEGVTTLEEALKLKKDFVQNKEKVWMRRSEDENAEDGTSSGLRIICSSSIHDDVLRQVRLWARRGFSAAEIQREMDIQYQEILHKSFAVQQQVSSHTPKDETDKQEILEKDENDAPEVTPESTPKGPPSEEVKT